LTLNQIAVDMMRKTAEFIHQGVAVSGRHVALITEHIAHHRRKILHHHGLVGLWVLALHGLLDILKQLRRKLNIGHGILLETES
jgi:hypothetical protein